MPALALALYAAAMGAGWLTAGTIGFLAAAAALVWFEKRRLHWQARSTGTGRARR